MYSVLHAVIPSLETTIIDKELGFPYFTTIDSLFNEGVNLPQLESKGFFGNVLPRLLKVIKDTQNNILLFETPEMMDKDKFGWMRDEEFCRQTLASLNPLSIRLVMPSYGLAEDTSRTRGTMGGQDVSPNELYSQSAIYIVAAHALKPNYSLPLPYLKVGYLTAPPVGNQIATHGDWKRTQFVLNHEGLQQIWFMAEFSHIFSHFDELRRLHHLLRFLIILKRWVYHLQMKYAYLLKRYFQKLSVRLLDPIKVSRQEYLKKLEEIRRYKG